jgi:hypothetical protein
VVEPSILGVTVAYGGYVAYGAVEGTGLIPLTAPAGMTVVDAASLDAPPEESESHGRRGRSE